MRSLVCLLLLVVAAVVAQGEDKYTTRWDSIDLDQILRSDRLLQNYYKCLMNTGRCTPDASDLKRILPDALRTKCLKCSGTQRQGAEKVIRFLHDNKPEMWNPLEKKYDPSGEYRRSNPDFFKN